MVLRGSNTHPQYDLFEVTQAIETARQYIKETELERKELEHELAEVIHEEVSHLREGEHTKVETKSTKFNDVKMVENKELQIPQDLTNAIRILVDRLDDLEKKHDKAETMLVTYRQELKVTCLQLLCGGVAGATARTVVSPIDRIKLLIQTARVREEQPKSMIATGSFLKKKTKNIKQQSKEKKKCEIDGKFKRGRKGFFFKK
ncbi:hypothetical protein RFI_12331 [Reticulomyxa filosa]|uniref:Uncharacterized protein n=1 Tax=Reticulomyxa filosa TaxID=46433 RepID=X6NER8_RETFI|nr:hypothetical protein RFI_12331 [Reticulomyxa filosa]|eukprot:ETO24825.1 hypothetical protein RFI_12331 [Reticulomyxa filosa]